jgi:glycopeptide antibiotics resistance protein
MDGPRYALISTIIYMLVVAAALVVPGSAPHAYRGYLQDIPLGRRLVADVALNVAMFVPIGWGLHRAARRRGGAPRTRLRRAVILAAAFSLTMETVQAWLPNRYSSVVDVLANTLGATIGAWLQSRYGHRV